MNNHTVDVITATENFARLFPLANERNLRIIALNRRDYKGSTLYSPEELSALPSLRTGGKDAEKAQAGFLTDRGFEIARFLARMIKDKDIPKISDNGVHGGIVLVGWSLGAITTLAFLANMSTYPYEIRELLSSHLRALLVYGSVQLAAKNASSLIRYDRPSKQ